MDEKEKKELEDQEWLNQHNGRLAIAILAIVVVLIFVVSQYL